MRAPRLVALALCASLWPASTGFAQTRALGQAQTPASDQALTPAPEQAQTRVPEQALTPAPEQARMRAPEQALTPAPEQAQTRVPEQAQSRAPDQARTPTPNQSQTPAPDRARPRVLELDAALAIAKEHAPELREAQANLRAAQARVDTAKAPLLPQVTATAGYNRSTFNFARGVTSTGSNPNTILQTRNVFSAGIRASQLIYDFGQSWGQKDSAEQSAQAQALQSRVTQLDIDYGVRSAYLDAGKARALVEVAQATLSNQQRHLAQIQGFVEVGTRPAIDLAQSRTDVANARLALLRAQNDYAAAKAQLSRSMGTPEASDFEVSAALPGAEADEDRDVDTLTQQSLQQRPEFQAFHAQLAAQQAALRSIKGQYGPTLNLVGSADLQGIELDRLAPNLSIGAALNWPLYQGGLTNSRVHEAHAQSVALQAQLETLQQDLRVAVTQAGLAIRAARAALSAADELVQLAKERVTLAEGRYAAGVGNTIELGDAELSLRDAQTQRVSAEYDLALARALLHRTLGRP